MRWWLRIELDGGTCSEHELPTGYGATWRVGTARSCDVRLPLADLAGEVTMDRWNTYWHVSAPGATTLDGKKGFVGWTLRHGDGFCVPGARMSMVMRGEWDERASFATLREALHTRDWSRAMRELYTWPRADPVAYRRAEAYALDLIAGVAIDEEEAFGRREGLAMFWRALKARS